MSRNKIGRNERCWCGSGKKFKHCHLDRDKQKRLPPWDVAARYRQAFKKKICSAPTGWQDECSQHISRTHTVPKSGSLRQIARNGHVYAFIPSVENLTRNNGYIVPELVGINNASTFSGFCSFHDNSIFSPIEKEKFTCSLEQCFLLSYRSLARETYTKNAATSLADVRQDTDRGKPMEQQYEIQEFNFLHDIGLNAGIKDCEKYKKTYDEILQKREFNRLCSYIIELEKAPDVMCSGGIFPEQDFRGNKLQDLGDITITPDLLTFTSFYGDDRGYIVFSWLPVDCKISEKIIQTLAEIEDADLTNALLRFFFEFCENVQLKPDWWEALPKETQEAVIKRMVDSTNPFHGRANDILKDDGLSFPNWNILNRHFVNNDTLADTKFHLPE